MRPPPSMTALPGKAVHVYTCTSTCTHITLLLGKATATQMAFQSRKASLSGHCSQTTHKVCRKKGKRRKRRQSVTRFKPDGSSCQVSFLTPRMKPIGLFLLSVPGMSRVWLKLETKDFCIFFCSVNLRQAFKKHLGEYPNGDLREGNQTSMTKTLSFHNVRAILMQKLDPITAVETPQPLLFQDLQASALRGPQIRKKIYDVRNDPLSLTVRLL